MCHALAANVLYILKKLHTYVTREHSFLRFRGNALKRRIYATRHHVTRKDTLGSAAVSAVYVYIYIKTSTRFIFLHLFTCTEVYHVKLKMRTIYFHMTSSISAVSNWPPLFSRAVLGIGWFSYFFILFLFLFFCGNLLSTLD